MIHNHPPIRSQTREEIDTILSERDAMKVELVSQGLTEEEALSMIVKSQKVKYNPIQ